MNIKKKLIVLSSALVFSTIGASAFTPFSTLSVDTVKKDTVKNDTAKVKKNEKKEEKKNEYDELIKKGGTTLNGLFTVRHIEDKWYYEVPDSLLGRYFLAVTRYTSVPQNFGKFSGEEVNEATVYFEKRDAKTLLLRAYVLSQLADEKDNISRTLKASTTDPIVASFKVIEKNPKKGLYLVEVTPLFKNDNNLVSLPNTLSQSMKLGGLQGDRTFIDTMKVYPTNIEIATTRTYSTSAATTPASQSGSVTLGLNTSMVILPKIPMRKRLWDERVGYFTERITYFNDEQHKTDREEIIARYRLVPKDVKKYLRGELVEPVKPIVYYIDPATPKKWVPYLIAGINDWNVAFEAAGFKHAIIGKEWPGDSTMSVDDARFCMLRYLPAEIENAYGPHIVDPRSGEIIESHICWYHNVMNLLTKWYMTQCGPLDKRAQTMKFDDKLMGELIRFVSSHEVGHTLGLRHNMGASSETPVEKLRDKAWVEAHGHTVSIMDYARFNYVAQPEDHISEKGLFPRINDYDKWAIKWGYQYRPEFKDELQEKKQLMTETTEVLKKNPRLWFGGEGYGPDPRSQTEDLGDDNVKASEYGIKNLKRVIAGLPTWAHQDNDQYDDLKEMYASVRDQFQRYLNHVLKNLGGQYINNMPGRKPYEPVPADKQREVFGYLDRQVFDAPLWLYPHDMVEKTGVDPNIDIENRQNIALSIALNASILKRIYDEQLINTQAYRLSDYLGDLFVTVWKPLGSSTEMADKCRRSLERSYLDNLNTMLNPSDTDRRGNSQAYNSDAMLYALGNLDKVEQFVRSQATTATDINQLHYKTLLEQIKLIRDRRTSVK